MVGQQRNPEGVTISKPIALRLKESERENAEILSIKKNITLSALARQAYLAGLPIVTESMLPISSGTSCGTEDSEPALLHQHSHA